MRRVMLVVALLLMWVGVAAAVEVRVQIESVWNGPEVTGGKLYMDGAEVTPVTFGTWTGTIEAPEGPHVFTMTAVFPDGVESAHSPEYEFYIIQNRPMIIIIK